MSSGNHGKTQGVRLHSEFLAAVLDAETYEAAVACAKGQGWPASVVINASISQVIEHVAKARPPSVIVVDLDENSEALPQLAQLVKAVGNRARILAIGSANDVQFYRGVVQSGCADYLVKPVSAISLREAVIPLLAAHTSQDKASPASGEKRPAMVTLVVGTRGGVGATTAAVNIAWLASHQFGRKAALLDLDLQFGNCALALDLAPGHGLRDLLSGPDRIDSVLINSALAAEDESLAVFGCEEALEDGIDFETSGALALLKELRGTYDHIVIDLPKSLISRHRRLFGVVDHIVVVADLTLASIRDAARINMSIQSLGLTVPIHVIIGRAAQGEAQVSRSTFEHGIKTKISAIIPSDPNNIRLSANRGKALASSAPNCEAVIRYKALTANLLGEEVAEPSSTSGGGFFKRLLGK